MNELTVDKRIEVSVIASKAVTAVMRMFGVTTDRLKETAVTHSCKVKIRPGDIIYITGPSGSGKSVILRELEKQIPDCERINLDQIPLHTDKAVIDCFDDKLTCLQRLKMLSTAGLSDVFCTINRPSRLSEGEKYRFRLAVALAAKKNVIFADEFCSSLDSVTASVISYRIRKYAKKHNVTFMLAGVRNDMLADLAADVVVNKEFNGAAKVVYRL